MFMGVVVGAAAAAALKVLFLVARISWPDNYFDSSDRSKHWVLEAPIKVFVWRTIPFVLVAILLIAAAEAFRFNLPFGLWSFCVCHLASTNLISLISAKSRNSGLVTQVLYLVVTAVVLATIVGILLTNLKPLGRFLPKAESLVQGFWTAVFVTAIFALFKVLTLSRSRGGREAGSLFQLGIDDYYIGYLAMRAFDFKADLPLMLAIIAQESSNRPKVLRQIELFLFKYSFGRMVPQSLGIAQQAISRLSKFHERRHVRLSDIDRDSLDVISEKFSGVLVPGAEVRFGPIQVKALANRHNGDSLTISAIADIYEKLFTGAEADMGESQITYEDDSDVLTVSGGNKESGGRVDLEQPATLAVNLPWVVRCGEHCYLQFKVSHFKVASVIVSSISSVGSNRKCNQQVFKPADNEFQSGLYKFPISGVGISVSVVDLIGVQFGVADLLFDARRDCVTVYSP